MNVNSIMIPDVLKPERKPWQIRGSLPVRVFYAFGFVVVWTVKWSAIAAFTIVKFVFLLALVME